MANFKSFPKIPLNPQPDISFLREVMRVGNLLMDGKTNNTGEITLIDNATSQIVKDINCTSNSAVFLTPVTAAAAGLTNVYVTAAAGQFTVTHPDPNSSTAKYRYAIIG